VQSEARTEFTRPLSSLIKPDKPDIRDVSYWSRYANRCRVPQKNPTCTRHQPNKTRHFGVALTGEPGSFGPREVR
jgi:hypothetical protein